MEERVQSGVTVKAYCEHLMKSSNLPIFNQIVVDLYFFVEK